MVPSGNARQWQRHLSVENPCLLFNGEYKAPVTNISRETKQKAKAATAKAAHAGSSSKIEDPTEIMVEALMKIFRKTLRTLKTEEKPFITVGVVGFPNVGKSSIVNALKHSRATPVSNHPGTTKTC